MNKTLTALFETIAISIIIISLVATGAPKPSHQLYWTSTALKNESFNLDGLVTEKSVAGLKYLLESAKGDENITIYINSPGGDVVAGMEVLSDMQTSKAAHIEAVVNGIAASMAEGIAMEADHITMRPGSLLMFHYGEVQGQVLSAKDLNSPSLVIRDYMLLIDGYMHTQDDSVLDKKAWDDIHAGKEYWLTSYDFAARGGDHFNGRKIENVYISEIINLITGFNQVTIKFLS